MTIINKDQSGFGLVESLVVIAAVVLLGVAGWFVYQHNKSNVTNAAAGNGATQQTTDQQSTSSQQAPDQSVVNVRELGIQITVPGDIKDLTYQVSTVTLANGNQGTLAMFSTKALAALDPECGTTAMPLGSLEQARGTYPTQSQDETNVLDYGQLVKQFPTFYISSGSPQAACSTDGSTMDTVSRFKGEFQAALSTIQPSDTNTTSN